MTMTTNIGNRSSKPWYREPWPWFLMAGPAIVIVAGSLTAWLAVASSDGLVTDDYYRKGLAAGQTVAQSRRATELGIRAGMRLTEAGVSIRLEGKSADMPIPSALHVTLSHPTRAGIDQKSLLRRAGELYVGELHLPTSGHWLVLIEDEEKSWRLMGSVMLPAAGESVIGGESAAGRPQS